MRAFKGKLITFLLCLAIVIFPVVLFATRKNAGAEETIVRVGWFDSGFNKMDEFGRRSGYAYEYERKISAYTGWKYEYVSGNWSDLLTMLRNGEIDLLGDVSYVEERAKDILYSSIPMGTETYFIFTASDNSDITAQNYSSLEGKKVGVSKGTYQVGLFNDWLEQHEVTVDYIELTGSESESMEMLLRGELDAYVTLDSYGNPEKMKPVWKIGSSDFFFAVNKNRPELLGELDAALSMIQDENLYYNQNLYEKYLGQAGTNVYLNISENEWLDSHGKIRVGYQDNYLAFCAKDKSTGEMTGALKDYLDYVSQEMKNARIEFEAIAYPTAQEAIDAMKAGEVDCMFPANLTDYDGEMMGIVMTPALMCTEMDAVVRSSDKKEFFKKDKIVVAVNEGNPNYDLFLVDNFPGWEVKHYKDTSRCLDAIADGDADCIIISNYRFNNISKKCEKLNLTTVYTGVNMDYCFAVCEGNVELYSILSKVATMVPETVTNAALTYYSTEDVKAGFWDIVKENLVYILAAGLVIVIVILILAIRSIRLERKANAERQVVKDLNRKVFVDALTSVRNKGAFDEFREKLQKRLESEEKMCFAMGMLDCDNLKQINDKFGHEKGDIYLKNACRLICKTFDHSPVFRIGGDEFAVVLEGADFENMEALTEDFKKNQKEICEAAENSWDEVHISMGIAIYDPGEDDSVEDTVRRADKIMYENKRLAKQKRSSELAN